MRLPLVSVFGRICLNIDFSRLKRTCGWSLAPFKCKVHMNNILVRNVHVSISKEREKDRENIAFSFSMRFHIVLVSLVYGVKLVVS